jgi:hypothetical protein
MIFIIKEKSLYSYMPGVFNIKVQDNTVFKKLDSSNPVSIEIRTLLSNKDELSRYKNTLSKSYQLPIIGKYISNILLVDDDGSYEMKFIDGINLMDILSKNNPLCVTAGWDSKEIVLTKSEAVKIYSNVVSLERDLHLYSKKYCLIGDWFLHNLIYDINENKIVNIDLEGFYTYKYPSPMCDLQFYVKRQFDVCKDNLITNIGGDVFSFILWEPCKEYQSEIYNYIETVSTILYDCEYSINDMEKFVYDIYKLDVRCHKPYLPKKIETLSRYNKCIRVLFATIKNPFYDNQNVSKVAVRVKENIRGKYKDKIDNYYKDIIIHISDNSNEAKLIQHILLTM